MALYLGGIKVAGAGGSGNANVVSCSSYEEYKAMAHDPKTVYVTPDSSGSGGDGDLSGYAKLSADNIFTGASNSISVANIAACSNGSDIADDHSFILTKNSVSKNVQISDLNDYITNKLLDNDQITNKLLATIYPVGSIYLDGNNASVCPISVVIKDSIWENVGTKILTGGSTAPVVGNGKALGLLGTTNSTDTPVNKYYLGYKESYAGTMYPDATADTADPEAAGATSTVEQAKGNNQYVGVTTVANKSGLVANIGDATGLAVTIWKRTA